MRQDSGTFSDVTSTAFSTGAGDSGNGRAAVAADFDDDGDFDIYVSSRDSANALYQYDSSAGTFTDVASSAGVDLNCAANSQGVTAGDYDGDGDIDL